MERPMSIMYIYIKCKRYNCFKKEAGKYKLFEYTESPNVFSDERLQSADSAGGHDSSQHQRLSLERNIYFQINPLSFSFFHFIQVGKKTCQKDFVAEKVEGKANIIRGCLTQGSLGTTGPLEGEGSEDLPTI